MAEFVVSAAATQLTNLIVQEAKYLGGVDDQLKQLKTDLQMMQSFLRDADARREESNAVRQCVVQIKSIAYDIEDLIETFELKIASKRKGGCAKAIKRYTCIFREATRLHEIRSQLDKIRGRIDQWTRWLQRYGMKSMMEGGSSSSACSRPKPDRCSYPHIEETVFGLDHGIEELVSVLGNHQETSKRVVAICGMAGVGKTTLAKKVYRELRDKTCFDKFAWVYVSQQFEKETVWEKILSCFGLVIDQTGLGKLDQTGLGKLLKQRDSDELARKLYNFLRDNRCLVVLDDIWSPQAWDILKPGFPEEETNSKILLTSRNQAVAFHVDARAHLHQLECLDRDASWDLFEKTAFPRGQYSPSPDHPRLEELGREMVKHCACLPLAIVVLGGVLAPKYGSYHEWQQVHDNVKSYIRRGMDCKVKDILSLSYDDLPSYLKPCFLYLAHFPEDYEMDVDVLVQMWIAEGFVSEVREEDNILLTMEDEAYHYLIELLERNMIRVGRQDSRTKKIRTCLMHDVMREFCLDKAREEISLHILDRSHEDVSVDGNNNIYRLAMHELAWSLSVPRVTHLRSFIYFGGNMNIPDSFRKEWYWFNKATYHIGNIGGVRTFKDATLAIFYTWIVIHVIKQTITHLFNNAFKRLRVLCVDKLPLLGCGALDNIGNLIHLRYLCLARCLLVKLPTSLGKLRRLKTLDLRVNSGDFSIRIPDDIWSLRQLQHLYLPESCHYKAKLKLGNLQNLQTLVNLPVKNSHSIASLVDLKNLRELRICGAIEIIDEAVRLRNYCCFSTCCCTGIGSDGQFQYVGVEEDPMPMLEKLPNLRILALEKRAFIGKKMEVSTNGFQSLEGLEIHLLPDLEEFSTAEGAMPRLCIFDVQDCSKLKLLSSQLPPIQA